MRARVNDQMCVCVFSSSCRLGEKGSSECGQLNGRNKEVIKRKETRSRGSKRVRKEVADSKRKISRRGS